MPIPKALIRIAAFATLLVGGTAVVAAPSSVTFDIKFSGHVDCETPVELIDVPLSIKAKGVLNVDGTGSMETALTAYYILTAKSSLEGKLGGPPVPVQGGTASLKVLNKSGLTYTLNYPQTRYTVNINVDGKKCGAELIPKLKGNNRSYQIFAIDAEFRCSRFQVEKSTCKVK